MRNSKKQQQGFALLQVIVATSLTAGLALVIANLMSNQSKAVNFLEDQLEKISLIRNLEVLLKDNIACQVTFKDLKINKLKVNIEEIKDPEGNIVFTSNSEEGFLKIGQIFLTSKKIVPPNSSGLVELNVPISRIREGGGVREFKNYVTKVLVSTNSSTEIEGCSADSDSGFRKSCPSGYSLIGTPGEQEAFCISTNKEPKTNLKTAVANCYNRSPRARLCRLDEWLTACTSGIPNDMVGQHNFLSEFGDNAHTKVVGFYSCEYGVDGHKTSTYSYRCCFK